MPYSGNVIDPVVACSKIQQRPQKTGRYLPCPITGTMRLSPLTRSALVLIPLLLCANRIHAQRTANMQGTTQEVNRCLTMVRVAASRRRNRKNSGGELDRLVKPAAAARSGSLPPHDRRRTA
jgi:hypothetical protein